VEQPTEPLVIELEIPESSALYYLEGALRSGYVSMQAAETYLTQSNDLETTTRIHEAQRCMSALIDTVVQARIDLIKQHSCPKESEEINAAIVPQVEQPEIPGHL
jgi:hypothetical protein